jgi:hypothetical protein
MRYIVGSDPELHIARIREAERLGATIERVLPALKGARV